MANLRRNIVASALFTIFGGPGILLLLIPWLITRFEIPASGPAGHFGLWHFALAALLIAIGLVPLFDSIARFIRIGGGTLIPNIPTERLVISGLYRFVRNPMYVGVLTALAGEILLFQSRDLLYEFFAVFLGFEIFVRLYEEPKLKRTYGSEYERYKSNVRRWIPRATPWRGGDSAQ